jgi:hypothetical protein
VLAMAGLGWYRGTLVQVVTIAVAGLLLGFFEAWYPPLDTFVAGLAVPLGEHPYLRKLVGFLGAYIAVITVVAVIELASRGSEKAQSTNRAGGVVIGLLKGIVYVVALAWVVETAVLWEKPPHELAPSWLRESQVVAAVAPWNPVRVYALRDAVEVRLARAEFAARQREGEPLDEAAAATTPDDAPSAPQRPGLPLRDVESSDKARALYRASPVRALMDETASLSEWEGRGYGDLVRDPRVRAILADADIADLLMGE